MRQFHSTITPRVIHRRARQVLGGCLDWQPFHDSVGIDDLLDLLLLMAATTASLFATVRRFFSFSHQTATLAVRANLPTMERLIEGLVHALYDVMQFGREDRRRHWLLAIDIHNVAYYGQRTAEIAPYVVGGPKKQGTKWFFSYATAVLLHRQRRYTVALCPLRADSKPHDVVRLLLDQIATQGLKIRGVALDSGFDSGDTILLLQERGLSYTVPLRRKGKGRNARNRCFEGRHQLIRWVEWKTDKTRRLVRTRTLLWHGRAKTMVFAFQGWSGVRAHNVHEQARRQRQLYRRRFGIETSYRQKNQAQASTTSRNPVYRLLLEGLGYVLRQLWVVFAEELARPCASKAGGSSAVLPLQQMVDWLAHELAILHPETLSIPATSVDYDYNVS
jgi:hypothetical protein